MKKILNAIVCLMAMVSFTSCSSDERYDANENVPVVDSIKNKIEQSIVGTWVVSTMIYQTPLPQYVNFQLHFQSRGWGFNWTEERQEPYYLTLDSHHTGEIEYLDGKFVCVSWEVGKIGESSYYLKINVPNDNNLVCYIYYKDFINYKTSPKHICGYTEHNAVTRMLYNYSFPRSDVQICFFKAIKCRDTNGDYFFLTPVNDEYLKLEFKVYPLSKWSF